MTLCHHQTSILCVHTHSISSGRRGFKNKGSGRERHRVPLPFFSPPFRLLRGKRSGVKVKAPLRVKSYINLSADG